MKEFNKYGLYSLNFEAAQSHEKDEIDKHIDFFNECNDIEKVRTYILEHFGLIEESKWIDYPELHKKCYILVSGERIEFCALKNDAQYYGKGWLLHKEDE